MKKLLVIGVMLMASVSAYAGCQNVYDSMNRVWRMVCQPDAQPQRVPQCRNVYDPMNRVWVLVCN
jgi:hypothetical protein